MGLPRVAPPKPLVYITGDGPKPIADGPKPILTYIMGDGPRPLADTVACNGGLDLAAGGEVLVKSSASG